MRLHKLAALAFALWAKAPMAKTVQAATATSVLMSRFIAFSPLETPYAERPISHRLLNCGLPQ